MTNAERIYTFIREHGQQSVMIHSIPNSEYWLVAQKTTESFPEWRIVLCDPMKQTWRLVSKHVTNDTYLELWTTLIEMRLTARFKHMTELYKKQSTNFNNKHHANNKLRSARINSKTRSSRHPAKPMDKQPSRRTTRSRTLNEKPRQTT